jgi:hypothetical protein
MQWSLSVMPIGAFLLVVIIAAATALWIVVLPRLQNWARECLGTVASPQVLGGILASTVREPEATGEMARAYSADGTSSSVDTSFVMVTQSSDMRRSYDREARVTISRFIRELEKQQERK